jgi:formylglycine-generating enzyme required for sulfatase activity
MRSFHKTSVVILVVFGAACASSSPPPTRSEPTAALPSIPPRHDVERVEIPAGDVWYGCVDKDTQCDSIESPGKVTPTAPFGIAKHPATVAEYQACIDKGLCTSEHVTGREWTGQAWQEDPWCNYGRERRSNFPMNCVNAEQATAFCAWAGGRLLTSVEWERALRGDSKTIYPWGDTYPPPAGAGNVADQSATGVLGEPSGWELVPSYNDGFVDTSPVCAFAKTETNPFSLCDMAGNVRKWTSDADPNREGALVVRGSAFPNAGAKLRASKRFSNMRTDRGAALGVRCAF